MQRWIKLEYDVLNDIRIQTLIKELGLKGFAIYAIMRLMIECRSDEGLGRSVLLSLMKQYNISDSCFERVLDGFDLFGRNKAGLIDCDLRVRERGDEREGERGGQREPEPTKDIEIDKENIKEKTSKKTKKGSWTEEDRQWQIEFSQYFPMINQMAQPLNRKQWLALTSKYPEHIVKDKIRCLERYYKIFDYRSAYLTLCAWLRKDAKQRNLQTFNNDNYGTRSSES